MVPEINAVYISEFDTFQLKRTIYHIEPTIIETKNVVDNGLHEVYVDTAIDDDSDISELMQCFLQTDVDNQKFPKLSRRVYFFKHNEEGIKKMCSISEEFREEGREEGRQEGRQEGMQQAILELLEDVGLIPEVLENKIREQRDGEVLKRWHKLAAKVETIEEFIERI